MGQQIIKQPNGKYAVWSSVVDNFIIVDATPEEIIEYRVADSREEITDRVNNTIEKLERGEKPSFQFTKSWEEAVEIIEDLHGAENETLKEIKAGIYN